MQFKLWVESAEPPPEYIDKGMVDLYRYSHSFRGETYLIDPQKASPRSYSRNEFRTAATQRTFFYLDPETKEDMIGSFLYVVRVPAVMIYNVINDPLGIKKQSLPDFEKMFEMIKEAGYSGVYYNVGWPVVCMFVPLLGHATSLEAYRASKTKVA